MLTSRHVRTAAVVGAAAWSSLGLATSAQAAAIERAVPSVVRILFEDGRYGELGFTYSDPDQSGDDANLAPLVDSPVPIPVEGSTGDLFEDYWTFAAAYKADLNQRLSYALFFDQPFGADTRYGEGTFLPNPFGFTYDGTSADLNTYQFTGLLAYDVTPNVKLYGGFRAERLDADASIPFIEDYSVSTDEDWGYGYVLGAAYHRPEIALRIALTYHSEIKHGLDTDEFSLATGDTATETDVDMPQSVTLEFQTGINPKTLIFGSIRWVDWSEFRIAPPTYVAIVGNPLVDYQDDWWTYNAGFARQITNELAGSLSLTYEPSVGGTLTTLGPYDGRTTITAALSYDRGPANFTGGVTYGRLGDTENVLDTDFNDGSVWGLGLRVGYSF
jgi:long-subunit fatty acid transport protein